MSKVEIKGLKELNKKLHALENIKHNQSILAGAIKLQELSQRESPVKTGFLRSTHSSRETEEGAEMLVSAEYAVFVHEGTRYMEGREWISKVIDAKPNEILQAVAETERKLIDGEV